MSKYTLSVKGTDKLFVKLKKNVTMQEVKDAVKSNTAEMQEKSQRNSPVDTGALKRSINLSILDDGLKGRVSPTMFYAPHVEWGTRSQTAKPFVGPAFNEQRILFLDDLNRLTK